MPKSPRRKRAPRTHFSIPEVAEMLGVDRSAVWRKRKAGKIRTEEIMGRQLVSTSELIRIGVLKEST